MRANGSLEGHTSAGGEEPPTRPRIAIVAGTRPEIIKLAPVYHALHRADFADLRWIHTGQHAQMAQEMHRCFEITPDQELQRTDAGIEQFSARCRLALDEILSTQRIDLCIVQGDTESAFLGALSAFYRHIPVAHVEAGLRTYNLERPFPEEGLRQMISRITDLHFAPTVRAQEALRSEGIAPDRIVVTGNTVIDAQLWACARYGIARAQAGEGHILVTVHRREHWGAELHDIFTALAVIACEYPHRQIVFPVHLNPVVREAAMNLLDGIPNVRLSAPFDYIEMQRAMAGASLVLTDSGGLQEEAPTFGVPVVVLRHETERPEAVEAGCAVLAGPRPGAILRETRRLLAAEASRARSSVPANPYGDGRAAARIATRIFNFLHPDHHDFAQAFPSERRAPHAVA